MKRIEREEDEKAEILDTARTLGEKEAEQSDDDNSDDSLEELREVIAIGKNTKPQSSHAITKVSVTAIAKEEEEKKQQQEPEEKKAIENSVMKKGSKATQASPVMGSNKMWRCEICTFAENPYAMPVCVVCGALPARARPSADDVAEAKPQAIYHTFVCIFFILFIFKKRKKIII
ncbi:hypothetical protein RFI_07968 [Reticulomyxa filosa]|uniref:RanBP2-type domain-containing protein n=1 Tax=Reticulomyxa filosa TaxID=46433 RepID=X6NT76_RETFI|nr:hypothetical protein RFI_07968 [Reticulomyxa filosa]|eukprot:ETO29158.1 hypothetical protein RFI_07968 [Reticulomyxa filosa]